MAPRPYQYHVPNSPPARQPASPPAYLHRSESNVVYPVSHPSDQARVAVTPCTARSPKCIRNV
ncbi:uncharacterized protein ColSpa_08866 [Colletotrichum spaethianum]|uniref:Uncharacterized protein n=1 Tax=Colletotrichum spaethianum TaxID=700344 RepID=A0AA37PAM8_9PEZI|nr:uncharacterized protein ColSpa_08866 [Colletotrichum spaethianum]GKT48685.1 hypothetical protein ColSpa_08866 [Colletotrichum spaethianum]